MSRKLSPLTSPIRIGRDAAKEAILHLSAILTTGKRQKATLRVIACRNARNVALGLGLSRDEVCRAGEIAGERFDLASR